jgi:hypothetical protein
LEEGQKLDPLDQVEHVLGLKTAVTVVFITVLVLAIVAQLVLSYADTRIEVESYD